MYLDYLKERYREGDFLLMTHERIASRFEEAVECSGLEIIKKPYGFVTYKLEGDAVIIYDMYVSPSFRGQDKAWELHNEVLEKATDKRVAITFVDKLGQNHQLGIGAIKAAGFKLHQATSTDFVFLKGI